MIIAFIPFNNPEPYCKQGGNFFFLLVFVLTNVRISKAFQQLFLSSLLTISESKFCGLELLRGSSSLLKVPFYGFTVFYFHDTLPNLDEAQNHFTFASFVQVHTLSAIVRLRTYELFVCLYKRIIIFHFYAGMWCKP